MATMGGWGRGEEAGRKQLARYSRLLHRLGFTPGTAGNLSMRLDGERILATPTGCSKRTLRAEDMVVIDRRGRKLCGQRNVTSEIGIHLAVYDSRSDAGAVVHAHPPVATAFASSGRSLEEPLCEEIVISVGPVPLAPYALTGSAALADAIAPLVPGHNAVLLANHGALTYGEDLSEAFLRMETVEHFAQVMLVAEQLGAKKLLGSDQVAAILKAKEQYLRNARSQGSARAERQEEAAAARQS